MTDRKSTTATPKKARWSTAKKAEARQKKSARQGPREERPQWRAERRPVTRDDRQRSERPRGGRDDRRPFERDDRRPVNREDRPRYERSDNRSDNRSERRPFERDERRPYNRDSAGGDRPRYERSDRPRYERSEPRSYSRDERRPVNRDERRPYNRDSAGGDRPRYERSDRPRYERSEPRSYSRDDRRPVNRDERRPYNRDNAGSDRARYERSDRPRDERSDRPRYERSDRPRDERSDRPRYERSEPRSYGRDDRRPVNRDERRPYNRDNAGGDRPRDERSEPRSFAREDRPKVTREERPAPIAEHVEPRQEQRPAADVTVSEENGFLALGLPEVLVRRMARDGITEPFPIQSATIPDALAGRDVLGRGRTGSGKTLSFGLPLLTRLTGGRAQPKRPRALVLVPTRELAMQVSDALQPLVHVLGLRHKLVAGGMPYPPQLDALDRGVDLLVATPGRMNDLVDRGAAILDAVEVVVLDEADHMAEMGFLPEVTGLLDLIPEGGQRLLFSATLDRGVDGLVERYLTDPVTHSTDDATASVTTMAHHILLVEPSHKKVITAEVANRTGRTVVFVRTKLGADRVALQLREEGVFAAALHGGLNQGARNRVLSAFKAGTLPVLVATDVAARGIHVDDVSVVLQVDPPADHKDYLHRAGRTARAGEDGTVVTLALPHQRRAMERIAEEAGLETRPVRVRAGDDTILAATGARKPSGEPVSEEQLRRITEAPRHRRGPGGGSRFNRGGGGPRGPRREGGYREGGGQRRFSRSS